MNLHFFRRLRLLRRRAMLDRELAEEMEFHRAMKEQEMEGRGLPPDWAGAELDFAGRGLPERLAVANVPANFLPTLCVSSALGRNFSNKEDLPDSPHVAILSNSFWHHHFSSGNSALGENINLNSDAYTIIGILPASFRFPGNVQPEILIPAQLPSKPNWGSLTLRGLNVIGRLRNGITPERAKADLRMITNRQEANMPAYVHHIRRNLLPLQIIPLQTFLVGDTRWTLLLLLAAVAVLLGISCANVTNLQLSRAAARQCELALRAALGAGRGRLMRFLIIESLLVALAGGGCGILLAWALVRLLGTTPFLHLTGAAPLSVDATVLVFTFLVSLLTGLACGLFPALFASKPVLYAAIRGGGVQLVGLGARFRGFFVVGQVALTLVLLVGALLFLRSLQQVLAVDPGFQPDNVLTLETHFPDARNRKPAEMANMVKIELERIAALPGIRSAGASSSLFLTSYHLGASSLLRINPPPLPARGPQRPSLQ